MVMRGDVVQPVGHGAVDEDLLEKTAVLPSNAAPLSMKSLILSMYLLRRQRLSVNPSLVLRAGEDIEAILIVLDRLLLADRVTEKFDG